MGDGRVLLAVRGNPTRALGRLVTVALLLRSSAGQDVVKQAPKNMEHSAKIAISLLRYAGELPADRVFYEAGMGCKEMEWQNMAFVFLNRCASSFSILLLEPR